MARRAGSDGMRTETAIREAAVRLIARHGFEAMTMRRLAEEVGLGAPALYRYFPTKQALLRDLLLGHMEALLADWRRTRLPKTRPGAERLERFTRFHVRHHLPRANEIFLSYMELRSLTPEHYREIAAKRAEYEGDLVRILADGDADGSLRCEHPKIASKAVIACLTGITTWYRPAGPLPPAEIEDAYWTMIARMCGAQQTEARACSMPA